MTADELAAEVCREAGQVLDGALDRIRHCLAQLSDEQVWWRPVAELNSIGNLVLHLCGNVQQWLVVGLGGGLDSRNRPAEFAERGPIVRDELLRRLAGVVAAGRAVLARQTAADLGRVRRIQGFEVSGLAALFDCVPHFRGHMQEIIALTRQQLGPRYRFFWQPATPEQGAAT